MPLTSDASHFLAACQRIPTWKQRIQSQYRHWLKGNPNYGANDVCIQKPADDVVMAGDLPYPERKTATALPWAGVRGTPQGTPQVAPHVGDDGSILLEAQRLVHGPRQDAYGHPANDFSRTAALLNIILAGKLRDDLDAADVALMMVCVKLSREVNKHGRDNLVDAAGYLETRRMVLDYFLKLQG